MDYTKEEFSRKLIEFFDRHDPDKKRMVPAMVEEFEGQEEEVFDELTRRYVETDDEHNPKKSGGGTAVPNTPNTGGTP